MPQREWTPFAKRTEPLDLGPGLKRALQATVIEARSYRVKLIGENLLLVGSVVIWGSPAARTIRRLGGNPNHIIREVRRRLPDNPSDG